MATVTSSRRRGERSSGSKKVAASKPKLRQTSVANREVQSGTPKPGTYTSNNTMAKNSSPTNKRGGAQRKTGGQAGGRAGRPSGPVAGTKDKTVRVPSSWKAQTVDPTNQRGGNQRPTGGLAGGRAGRPSGNIARPSPSTRAGQSASKPSAKAGPKTYQVSDPWAKPTRASIGNVKGPASSPNRPAATPKPTVKPSGNFKAPSIPKGAVKTATKGASVLGKAGRLAGRATAVLTGAELFQQGQSGSELDQLTRAIGGKGSNPNTDIGKRAGDAIAAAFTQKSKYGPRFKNSSQGGSTTKQQTVGGYKSSKAPMPKGASDALREKAYASLQKFNVPKPKPTAKPAAPKAAAPSRSTAPARTTSSRTATKPAATKPKASSPMGDEFSKLSPAELMKGYGMRVNQTFSAESPATPKKRQSLKDQVKDIRQMIEESKKRQGKG